jgi:hypothetical protein
MYGVNNELKVCEVDVKGMGIPLTRCLIEVTKLFPFDAASKIESRNILTAFYV